MGLWVNDDDNNNNNDADSKYGIDICLSMWRKHIKIFKKYEEDLCDHV